MKSINPSVTPKSSKSILDGTVSCARAILLRGDAGEQSRGRAQPAAVNECSSRPNRGYVPAWDGRNRSYINERQSVAHALGAAEELPCTLEVLLRFCPGGLKHAPNSREFQARQAVVVMPDGN